ncbi:MAG TPA: glycosyltransferase family 4 protein, partial [Phycisphaerae bacterium]|nr:glycosyltransferase family 4 protein [Phycisphaerae bacterium]
VVGRRSRPGEEDMTHALVERGAVVLEEFLPEIEEVYRSADLYLFAVEHERSAIGMPLSVLEAMACNLPVVTTPFGGLVRCFDEVPGVYFADTPEAFQHAVLKALTGHPVRTREAVDAHSWEHLAAEVLGALEG